MPGVAAPPGRPRFRDRRRRDQGLRLRAPAPPRVGRSRPPLGGGLEVPADDRQDAADRGALERRQVRRPAPVRRARAGPGRWCDGADGDAAQRGGPRPQGPAPGRRGDRPARRRRDPPGRLARAARRREPRPSAAAGGSVAVPDLRDADGQGRRRRLHELPEPRVPGPPVAAAAPLRLARRDGHRRAWREAGRRAARARAGARRRRPLRADRGPTARARRLRRDLGETVDRGDRRLAPATVLARALRDRHRGGRRGHGAQPGVAVSPDRSPAGGDSRRRSRRPRGSDRRWRRRSPSSSRRPPSAS